MVLCVHRFSPFLMRSCVFMCWWCQQQDLHREARWERGQGVLLESIHALGYRNKVDFGFSCLPIEASAFTECLYVYRSVHMHVYSETQISVRRAVLSLSLTYFYSDPYVRLRLVRGKKNIEEIVTKTKKKVCTFQTSSNVHVY